MTDLSHSLPPSLPPSLGIYNFTNPGAISHNQILALYKKHVDPSYTWENFTVRPSLPPPLPPSLPPSLRPTTKSWPCTRNTSIPPTRGRTLRYVLPSLPPSLPPSWVISQPNPGPVQEARRPLLHLGEPRGTSLLPSLPPFLPGAISHTQILALYKKHVDLSYTWENVTVRPPLPPSLPPSVPPHPFLSPHSFNNLKSTRLCRCAVVLCTYIPPFLLPPLSPLTYAPPSLSPSLPPSLPS